MDIRTVARNYEHAAHAACREAEEAGQDAPALVSVFASVGGYKIDFLAPRCALLEVRQAIIGAGGAYRAAFV